MSKHSVLDETNVPRYRAAEGQRDAFSRFFRLMLLVIAVIIGCMILRYVCTTWYIDTHCTYVLGTRVCQ